MGKNRMNITVGGLELNEGFCAVVISQLEIDYGSYSLLQVNSGLWEINNFWIEKLGKFVAL